MEIIVVAAVICGVGLGAGELVRIYLRHALRFGTPAGLAAPRFEPAETQLPHRC